LLELATIIKPPEFYILFFPKIKLILENEDKAASNRQNK